jgi:hypothetical protein
MKADVSILLASMYSTDQAMNSLLHFCLHKRCNCMHTTIWRGSSCNVSKKPSRSHLNQPPFQFLALLISDQILSTSALKFSWHSIRFVKESRHTTITGHESSPGLQLSAMLVDRLHLNLQRNTAVNHSPPSRPVNFVVCWNAAAWPRLAKKPESFTLFLTFWQKNSGLGPQIQCNFHHQSEGSPEPHGDLWA